MPSMCTGPGRRQTVLQEARRFRISGAWYLPSGTRLQKYGSTPLPYFWSLVPEGRFVGTSGTGARAVNSFCYEHYKEPTVEENAALPDTQADAADKQSDKAKTKGKSKGDDANGDPPDDKKEIGLDDAADTAVDES